MRRILTAVAIVSVLPLAQVDAGEKTAAARAILDRAIEAHGGKDVLSRYKGLIIKSRGRFFGRQQPIDYTATSSFQAPDRLRIEGVGRSGNTVITVTRVVNGNQGWRLATDPTSKTSGRLEVMNEEQMKEAREQMHLTLVSRFVPLLERDYQLEVLGETDIGRRHVVGLRVQRKSYRDIQLFFDKEDGLLRMTRVRVKDVYSSNREVLAETTHSLYRKVKGMAVAHKVVTRYDNEPYIEYEVTEAVPVERLDERLFRKP
jgi:hypothetical protein